MQLFKSPFQILSNYPGLVELLLLDGSPSSIWETALSQTFDGSYTDVHQVGGAIFEGIRRGFKHPSLTQAQMQVIYGQSTGLRSRGSSWIFGRTNYDPSPALVEDAQCFARVRRLDLRYGTPSDSGTSPGAGTTWSDAGVDFPALGVSAGDTLVILSGANAGQYLVASSAVGSITLDATTALGGSSGPDSYEVYSTENFGGGANRNYLIPAPYWNRAYKPILSVEATAPNGASIAESEILVFPRSSTSLTIRNLEAGGGTDLVIALDDDGPEITIPGGELSDDIVSSAHMIAVRGNGGTADFSIVATFTGV